MGVLRFSRTLTIIDIISFYIYSTLVLAQLGIALSPGQKCYDGVKVFRIDVGDDLKDVAAVEDMIANLNLPTWTSSIVRKTHVDLEVPGKKLDAFKKAVDDSHVKVSVMHEDLGVSISAENDNSDGQCEYFIHFFSFSYFILFYFAFPSPSFLC